MMSIENDIKILAVILLFILSISLLIYKKKNITILYKFIAMTIFLNLLLSVLSPGFSILNWISFESIDVSNRTANLWGERAHIGDLLAGHFIALLFIGLLFVVDKQTQSIGQMNKSLELSDEAIKQQSQDSQIQSVELAKQSDESEKQSIELAKQSEESKNQTEVFKFQREEMEAQRREMLSQRKEMVAQRKEMKAQSFNNKFFEILNLFNNIIGNFQYSQDRLTKDDKVQTVIYMKKDVLKQLKVNLLNSIRCINIGTIDIKRRINKIETLEQFQPIFNQFNKVYDTTFKYYFINLYQILQYIKINEEADLKNAKNDESKETVKEFYKSYANIVRAQLSRNELVMLFYNAYMIQDTVNSDKYIKIIEHFSLFEHLTYTDLDIRTSDFTLVDQLLVKYDESAFGQNIALLKKREFLLDESLI